MWCAKNCSTTIGGKEFTTLKFQRRDANTGEMVEFDENEESDGTRALLFAFAGLWMDVMEHSLVLVVDELDSSLHPFGGTALGFPATPRQ